MPSIVLVGAQWGDEGKGKITDYLASNADAVVRYQGGNNAGHTLVVGEETYKLHLVPSGILYPGKPCVLGNGVVIDPQALVGEVAGLRARGIDTAGLFVSETAHCILPYHKLLDAREEAEKSQAGGQQIGTTGRGIGPAYRDKVNRVGIRLCDLREPETLRRKLEQNRREKEPLLGAGALDWDALVAPLLQAYDALATQVGDASELINSLLDAGKKVLFEGAQGTFLDLDHGTYPNVTSSTPSAGGACVGTGVGPTRIDHVVGVTKAYATRVGMGPFPSELHGDEGMRLVSLGAEYGTTTGRQRRTGWLDTVMLRRAVRINGLTALAVTKLDVLDTYEELRIAVAYEDEQGRTLDRYPPHPETLLHVRPRYETWPGWCAPTTGARTLAELPPQARSYLARVAELAGVPIELISVGAGRETTIAARDPWEV